MKEPERTSKHARVVMRGVRPLCNVNMHFQNDVYEKRFAQRVAMMIESRLIWYKHYYQWADELIMALENPPGWLLEIATLTHYPSAAQAINLFVYSEPFEAFDSDASTNEYVACLFLRFERGEISWATFLNEAGSFTDAQNGRLDCSYFYLRLNALEANEYAKKIEQHQRKEVENEFGKAIAAIKELYDIFLQYLREYVAKEA